MSRAERASRDLRIAVVDDAAIVRAIAPTLFPEHRVTTFHRVESFLRSVAEGFDVVVLDLQIRDPGPGGSALQGVAAVRASVATGVPVLIYTSEPRPAVLAACLAQGAAGITHKNEDMGVLVDAVHRVAQGGTVVTEALAHLAEFAAGSKVPTLTGRQQEALYYRARGFSHQQAATRMGISTAAAQEHWYAVVDRFREFLRDRGPADLEILLGLTPDDLLYPGWGAHGDGPPAR